MPLALSSPLEQILLPDTGATTLPLTKRRVLKTTSKKKLLAPPLLPKIKKKEKSAIAVSPPHTKEMTLIPKLNTCKTNIQDTKLYPILDPVLTSSVKGFYGYSKGRLIDLSLPSLLPIEIASVDFPSNCLNGSLNTMESNSWFKMYLKQMTMLTSVKTSCPSFMSSHVVSTDAEGTKKEKMPTLKEIKIEKEKAKKKVKTKSEEEKLYNCSFIDVKNDIGLRCNKKSKELQCPKHISLKQASYKYLQPTIVDSDIEECTYILVSKNKEGRKCTSLCLKDKDVNLSYCKDHYNKKQKEFKCLIKTCQYTITQLSKKGLKCSNECIEDSEYCKEHIKRISQGEYQRSFKCRFYPTKDDKQKIYNKFFGDVRKTYNNCIINNKKDKNTSFQHLRNKMVTNVSDNEKYLLGTPKEIRAYAVRSFVTSINTNMDLKREGKKKKFHLRYKSKKCNQTIEIPKESITIDKKERKIYIYKTIVENHLNIKRYTDKKLNEIINKGYFNHNIKLTKTRTNKYFIHITYDVIKSTKVKSGYVSNDPGECSFVTLYGKPTEETVEVLEIENLRNKIYGWYSEIDNLKSYYDKRKKDRSKKNRQLQLKVILKKYEKIQNRILDMHYKIINYMMKYKKIYTPKLNTKKLVSKKLKLTRQVKRSMLALSHSKFISRLISKAEIMNSDVIICDEMYTTRTCGSCFSQYKPTGRIYKCRKCGIRLSRDINASRNILIRNLIPKE